MNDEKRRRKLIAALRQKQKQLEPLQRREDIHATNLLEKLGFKLGQKFTHEELERALAKHHNAKFIDNYPPDEIIDDANIILNSSIIDTTYTFARKVND